MCIALAILAGSPVLAHAGRYELVPEPDVRQSSTNSVASAYVIVRLSTWRSRGLNPAPRWAAAMLSQMAVSAPDKTHIFGSDCKSSARATARSRQIRGDRSINRRRAHGLIASFPANP
jgi:hypothetical protein